MRPSFALVLGLAGCVDFDARPPADAARADAVSQPVDARPDAGMPTVDAARDASDLVEQ